MSQGRTQEALIIIDVQRGFDRPEWGTRNNPACESNIGALIKAWRSTGEPVIFVRHDSQTPESPLAPGQPGNEFKDVITGDPDLFVRKHVHSAFFGKPDLHEWLEERAIRRLAICGITTNHCCETTARVAADLGYTVRFVLDATHTFEMHGPDGRPISADELTAATAAGLHGEFAEVVMTRDILAAER